MNEPFSKRVYYAILDAIYKCVTVVCVPYTGAGLIGESESSIVPVYKESKRIIKPTSDISKRLYHMINDHFRAFGNHPKGIILGSEDYMEFATWATFQMDVKPVTILYPTEFLGLPITVCRRPRMVDVSITHLDAVRYIPHVIK